MKKTLTVQVFTARTATFLVAISVLLLAGCSTVRVIDSDVAAFQTWTSAPPGPGTTYQFERLPSQQAAAAQQDAIEAAARPALAKVGLVPNVTAPRYSVQVLLSTQLIEQVYGDPFFQGGFGGYPGYGYRPRAGYGRYGGYGGFGGFGSLGYGSFGYGGFRGASLGLSFPIGVYDAAIFRHELAVLMRDNRTQQVSFETRTRHDGPWNDTLTILPAMLDAALQGFPQPPAGTRRINVPLAPLAH